MLRVPFLPRFFLSAHSSSLNVLPSRYSRFSIIILRESNLRIDPRIFFFFFLRKEARHPLGEAKAGEALISYSVVRSSSRSSSGVIVVI
jgi:hypothetical protein